MNVITHKRGDSFKKIIHARTKSTSDEGVVAYTDIDLTDASIWLTIKENMDDSDDDALLLKKITSHTTPAEGKSNTSCEASEMDFAVNDVGESYFAEFQILDSSGNVMSSETFAWKQIQDLTQVFV